MACDHRPPTFFQFFKILWEVNLPNEKIRVPSKFSSRYERGLPNPVLFKIPADGTEWRVHWTKRDDGGIWFENGWKEFAEYYSLAHGHMLLFKYDVNISQFEVCIFDKSTAEIDYPRRVTSDVEANNDADEDSPTQQVQQEHKGKDRKFSERGKSKRSSKNPSFELKMCPSYVKGSHIGVPAEFGREYGKDGDACLEVDGRIWPVKFRGLYKIQRGWPKFRRENHLELGDVCVFVLTDSNNATFSVQINRAADSSGCSHPHTPS